jgi:hypothetical protein
MAKKMESTKAVHLKAGDKHVVGVKSLHVMLIPDGKHWFAQGMEIDYAACASTIEAVKANFSNGLAKTIAEHLAMYGDIEKVLKVAPQEAWAEYFKALTIETDVIQTSLTQVQIEPAAKEISSSSPAEEKASSFPFDEILFVSPKSVKTAACAEPAATA